MARALLILVAAAVSIAMLVGAYHLWFDWTAWLAATDRPRTLRWAVQCAAVAVAAAAQIVVLTFVARGKKPAFLRVALASVCCGAIVSAAAFGLAARE